MTADKKTESTAAQPATGAPPKGRKAWVPKTPVENILDQIKKQETRVSGLQTELDKEKSLLSKLLQAKKVLESV